MSKESSKNSLTSLYESGSAPAFDNFEIEDLAHIENNVGNKVFDYYKVFIKYGSGKDVRYFHRSFSRDSLPLELFTHLQLHESEAQSKATIELGEQHGETTTSDSKQETSKYSAPSKSLEIFSSNTKGLRVKARYNLDQNVTSFDLSESVTLRDSLKDFLTRHRAYDFKESKDASVIEDMVIDQTAVLDGGNITYSDKEPKINPLDLAKTNGYKDPLYSPAYDDLGKLAHGMIVERMSEEENKDNGKIKVNVTIPIALRETGEADKKWNNDEMVHIPDTRDDPEQGTRSLAIKVKYNFTTKQIEIDENLYTKSVTEGYKPVHRAGLTPDEKEKMERMKIIATTLKIPEMTLENLAERNNKINLTKEQERKDQIAKLQKEARQKEEIFAAEINSITESERKKLDQSLQELGLEALEKKQKNQMEIDQEISQGEKTIESETTREQEQLEAEAREEQEKLEIEFRKKIEELEREKKERQEKILQEKNRKTQEVTTKRQTKTETLLQNNQQKLQALKAEIDRQLAANKENKTQETQQLISQRTTETERQRELAKKQEQEKFLEEQRQRKLAEEIIAQKVSGGKDEEYLSDNEIKMEVDEEPEIFVAEEVEEFNKNDDFKSVDFPKVVNTMKKNNGRLLLAVLDTVHLALQAMDSCDIHKPQEFKQVSKVQFKQDITSDTMTKLKQISNTPKLEEGLISDKIIGSGKLATNIDTLAKNLAMKITNNKSDSNKQIKTTILQTIENSVMSKVNNNKFITQPRQLSENQYVIDINEESRRQIKSLLSAIKLNFNTVFQYHDKSSREPGTESKRLGNLAKPGENVSKKTYNTLSRRKSVDIGSISDSDDLPQDEPGLDRIKGVDRKSSFKTPSSSRPESRSSSSSSSSQTPGITIPALNKTTYRTLGKPSDTSVLGKRSAPGTAPNPQRKKLRLKDQDQNFNGGVSK